jgi:L-cysteine:1D-myo-inositol 2-amino-2-deoxy-alpha-D-glucopyranoside ligase
VGNYEHVSLDIDRRDASLNQRTPFSTSTRGNHGHCSEARRPLHDRCPQAGRRKDQHHDEGRCEARSKDDRASGRQAGREGHGHPRCREAGREGCRQASRKGHDHPRCREAGREGCRQASCEGHDGPRCCEAGREGCCQAGRKGHDDPRCCEAGGEGRRQASRKGHDDPRCCEAGREDRRQASCEDDDPRCREACGDTHPGRRQEVAPTARVPDLPVTEQPPETGAASLFCYDPAPAPHPTSAQAAPATAAQMERTLLQPRRYDDLHLYNSLTRELEPFEPIDDRRVTMYVCGITPYDVGHLGHALVYVVFDTLRRWLEHNAYEVHHVQNITDVDDDMVSKSQELDTSIAELTERNHAIYLQEMDALNVVRPEHFPLASETIAEVIEMVEGFLRDGFAYERDGYVFFDVSRTPQFGRLLGLSGQELLDYRNDSMPAEPIELKRSPLDFLVWQPCTDEGASFQSPWGPGRPGWHIECSAMAQKWLCPQLDIHGGGKDLRYPHHDSEIVQSEAATGRAPYVRLWMHNGTMQLAGEKMSKSLGNLVKVSDLLTEGFTPNGIRLALLAHHYRDDRDFDRDDLARWEERARLLERAARAEGQRQDQLKVQPYRNSFQDAMDDDLDTPRAIQVLTDVAEQLTAGQMDALTGAGALVELGEVLGLRLRPD